MTWLDDRLAERDALEARSVRIFSEAPRIQGELWKEIGRQIEEAKKKRFGKIMMVHADELLLPVNPPVGQSSTEPRKLSLQLKSDHSAIVAKITGGDLTLLFDTDGSGVVMKHEGKTLSVPNAAIVILDRFLFPDLKRLDVNILTAWKGTNQC